jgi:hypothetical protein
MPQRVAHILVDYALEVRKLSYILPSGVCQTEALRLSEEMTHDAELWLRRSPAARSHLPSAEPTP